MFFSLTNSPAMFQMMINTKFYLEVKAGVFSEYINSGVIHTKQLPHETKAQHLAYYWKEVHNIFYQLAELNLYLKLEKCQFK
jgi:hypothetical protein